MKQGVDKLYEKTPVSALGALASGAFLRADHSDIQDIYAAIGNHSTGAQLKFASAAHNHTSMVFLWALDCQSTYRKILEFTLCITNPDEGGDSASIMGLDFLIKAMRRRLVALIAAMQKICEDGGYEFEPIASIAGIDQAMRSMTADAPVMPDLVDEYVAQYGGA